MRILIVEDEIKTAAYLAKGLTESGFVVDVAHDGDDGLHLAREGHYDAIVLDVMLPRRDGWSVIAAVRAHDPSTPILFLTARDAVEERVKGFELGADDYLVKPFAFSELLARLRSLVRRGRREPIDVLRIADLEIHVASRKASRGGRRLDLAPKEFLLLLLLARHSGEVLSRTLIAEQVWDMNFNADSNVVDVAIRRLRRKIDDPFDRKLIHTVRGAGYVFETRD